MMLPPKIVILLVEDHPLVRACMAEALLEAGFDALDTGNATEAIAMLDIRPDIKLVFADADLPGTMDGLKLAHCIRERWPPVKLILVSGRTNVPDETLPPGARFFSKPYHDAVIVQEMNCMLRRA
jgi:DNA-binding response OmpR family regulator